jgi:hypothetical protein
MRRSVSSIGALIVLFGSGIGQSQPAAPWNLVPHTVATDLRGAYDLVAVDMNKDGRADLLAVASATQDLVWFENPTGAARDRHGNCRNDQRRGP